MDDDEHHRIVDVYIFLNILLESTLLLISVTHSFKNEKI